MSRSARVAIAPTGSGVVDQQPARSRHGGHRAAEALLKQFRTTTTLHAICEVPSRPPPHRGLRRVPTSGRTEWRARRARLDDLIHERYRESVHPGYRRPPTTPESSRQMLDAENGADTPDRDSRCTRRAISGFTRTESRYFRKGKIGRTRSKTTHGGRGSRSMKRNGGSTQTWLRRQMAARQHNPSGYPF